VRQGVWHAAKAADSVLLWLGFDEYVI